MTDTGAPSAVEDAKAGSRFLRGTLAEELSEATPSFTKPATQVLKFHGIYQQDDRDTRRERQRAGLGKDWLCMVRTSTPGGVVSADQYLVLDRLAGEVADGTLRVTTRQDIQYHFTRKGDLPGLIRTLNEHLVTTLAACGDVVRNVVACPAPLPDRVGAQLDEHAAELSRHLKPRSRAYWQLWVDGERAVSAVAPDDDADRSSGADDDEPLYGPTYLPRKFKIALAFPGDNCVDVLSNDVGIVAHLDAAGTVEAFTLAVGGGLGMSHNDASTYPRLGDPLGTVAPSDLVAAVSAVVAVHRDHGDRSDRKHARLKYVVAERGIDWVRAEVVARTGIELAPPRPLDWSATDDHLGWHEQDGGRALLGIRVENGRIRDADDGPRLRTALRELVERYRPGVRFTPRQDVLLTDLPVEARPEVDALLADHRVPAVGALTPLARHAMACPALPTCGLAIAEAERVMPRVVAALEKDLEAVGLAHEPIHVRMTGCPNGCARPYSTEVGLVGRGRDHYAVFVGGAADGTRLNTSIADRVHIDEISGLLRPLFERFRDGRRDGETFGDFCARSVLPLAPG